jgi:hypothetical protein
MDTHTNGANGRHAERRSRWAASALQAECARVRDAAQHTANTSLYRASFALGQIIGSGALDRATVEADLLTAARHRGIPLPEARATLNSGIEAGIRQPRDLPQGNGAGQGPRAGPQRAHDPEPDSDGDAERNRDRARATWEATQSPEGTATAAYLASRGLAGPVPKSLRHHPAVKMLDGCSYPAMIAAVTDPATGEFLAIQRTALKQDGSGKAGIDTDKASLGPTKGGAVVLGKLEVGDTTLEGEGIETVLSAVQATGRPGIATLSDGTLGKPPLPQNIRRVVILGEHGSEAAAEEAARRRHEQGLDVLIAYTPGREWKDANDLLVKRGAAAVRGMIESARRWEPAGTAGSRDVGPDMSIIDRTRILAPALDLDMFGPWADWIRTAAAAKSAPIDYVALALLSAVAGVIGATRWVSPWDGWEEPSVLWFILVGPPSAGKSPAMDAIKTAVSELEHELASGFDALLRDFETRKVVAAAVREGWEAEAQKAVKDGREAPPMPEGAQEPEPPAMPRVTTSDTTIEKAAELLSGNVRGLSLWRDELSSWIANLEKYGEGDRAFWLEAYGARSYTVDRKKLARPLLVRFLAISILGGIQPERLAALLMAGEDDGLTARFLFTWPEPVAPRRPTVRPDVALLSRALRRLRSLDFLIDAETGNLRHIALPVEADALEEFQAWREHHHDESAGVSGLAASAYGKMPGQVLRLALALDHLWWAAEETAPRPVAVSRRALGAALDLIEGYFKPMLHRTLGEAALPKPERDAATLGRAILARKPEVVNARIVRREWRMPGLKEARDVNVAIGLLEEAGWLLPVPGRAGETAGRQRNDYSVHPAVYKGRR